ncbi:MAG TPA: ATP-binding protein [Gemmatimonadaceae bacterium]|jgi:signal transduction histidine kinase|nr:ATP-binding protein [Gemmatimonadaceae bacterium]
MDRLPLLTPRPPSALSRLALALALVLGAALAWAVIAELRFQRRTTERVSEDYLSLLARERVDAAAEALRSIVAERLGTQVSGTMASVYEALPPAAPRQESGAALLCDSARESSAADVAAPIYFRIDLRDSSFLASPAASANAIAWVRDTIATELQAITSPPGSFRSLASRHRIVIFGVKRAPFNAPVAVYGLVTCAHALASVLTGAHARSSADSIISIAAAIGNDTLVASTTSPAHALARAEIDGIELTAYPMFAGPLSGVVIEREGISSLALTLMLLGTIALASIAVVQLVRDRRAVRRQAELVMTISHELRTPLAQILLYSETLALDRVRGDDAKRAAAQRIVDETRRLVETVSNVVGLTRPERGRSRGETLVAPVVESAITRVRALSDARARIVVSVPGALRVRLADSSLLQVLTNVLDNALKFGSATQTVLVSAAREGSLVQIVIEDEGPGIPEALRDRVWTRYFRANGDSDAGGAGIGLSIVREIVVSAGGAVRAEDGARGGARIVLELPAADDS